MSSGIIQPQVPIEDDGSSESFDCISSPTTNDNQPAPRVRIHHPRYYVKDDMTVFLVNDEILFRVHRHYLDRESEIFRSYPAGTDEDPTPLDVSSHDFEALLEYFYDSVHDDIPKSREQWTSILSTATKFKMHKVRRRAIKELGYFNIDPVDKIVLAVGYDIPKWLKPAYIALCQREEPIREEEAEKLGLSTVVKLACAREKARDRSQDLPPKAPVHFVDGWGLSAIHPPSPPRDELVLRPAKDELGPSPPRKPLVSADVERAVNDVFGPVPPSVSFEDELSDSPKSASSVWKRPGGGKFKGKKGKSKGKSGIEPAIEVTLKD